MKAFQTALKKGLFQFSAEVQAYRDPLLPLMPQIIVGKSFNPQYEIKTWETATDSGGRSHCTHSFSENLTFKGEVIFDSQIANETRSSGGFVAVRGTFAKALDLRDFVGFEVNMKSSVPIIVTINLACESMFVNDIYQFHFRIRNTAWTKYHIRFDRFILTHGGKDSLQEKEMDHLMVESMGILVRSPNEPFELEIGEISAQPELLDRITLPAFRPHFEIPDELPERTRIMDSENLNDVAQSNLPESHLTK